MENFIIFIYIYIAYLYKEFYELKRKWIVLHYFSLLTRNFKFDQLDFIYCTCES